MQKTLIIYSVFFYFYFLVSLIFICSYSTKVPVSLKSSNAKTLDYSFRLASLKIQIKMILTDDFFRFLFSQTDAKPNVKNNEKPYNNTIPLKNMVDEKT